MKQGVQGQGGGRAEGTRCLPFWGKEGTLQIFFPPASLLGGGALFSDLHSHPDQQGEAGQLLAHLLIRSNEGMGGLLPK